mmetsp:Transcript_72543/g.203676  ORF Transcript_72543/g.203676 Transcript_72543/m.203676 type:complete len:204 (+) Transcript_72543:82-693(+)
MLRCTWKARLLPPDFRCDTVGVNAASLGMQPQRAMARASTRRSNSVHLLRIALQSRIVLTTSIARACPFNLRMPAQNSSYETEPSPLSNISNNSQTSGICKSKALKYNCTLESFATSLNSSSEIVPSPESSAMAKSSRNFLVYCSFLTSCARNIISWSSSATCIVSLRNNAVMIRVTANTTIHTYAAKNNAKVQCTSSMRRRA